MGKIFQALSQTREKISKAFKILSKNKVSSDSIDELEQLLLSADVLPLCIISAPIIAVADRAPK